MKLKLHALLVALFLTNVGLIADEALPQSAESVLIGDCKPKTEDQGRWNCSSVGIVRHSCQPSRMKPLDDFWFQVKDAEEIASHVKDSLKNNGVKQTVNLLACQGFHVSTTSNSYPTDPPTPLLFLDVTIFDGADTRLKQQGASWQNAVYCHWLEKILGFGQCGVPNSYSVHVRFDRFGRLAKIGGSGSLK